MEFLNATFLENFIFSRWFFFFYVPHTESQALYNNIINTILTQISAAENFFKLICVFPFSFELH